MLRKAGNAPGHKPVVVNFACVFAFVSVFVSVVAVLFVCCLVGCGWLWLVVVGCCWLFVGCLLLVRCLFVVYLLFVCCCCLFFLVVVVAAAIISFVGILVGRAARARARVPPRAPKVFLVRRDGFVLLVGGLHIPLVARQRQDPFMMGILHTSRTAEPTQPSLVSGQ